MKSAPPCRLMKRTGQLEFKTMDSVLLGEDGYRTVSLSLSKPFPFYMPAAVSRCSHALCVNNACMEMERGSSLSTSTTSLSDQSHSRLFSETLKSTIKRACISESGLSHTRFNSLKHCKVFMSCVLKSI